MDEIFEHILECPECAKKGEYARLVNHRENVTAFGSDLYRVCPECHKKYKVIFYD